MNPDTLLKLQAYLDEELAVTEARQVAAWLESDAKARELYEELRATKRLMADNDLEVKVPESREFYWSKIERQISPVLAAQPGRSWFWMPNWSFRWAASLAGAALLLALAVFVVKPTFIPQRLASYFHEIDTPLEEEDIISFHSQEAGMTVVWIAAK